ncbi:hypothetical protein BJ742DRAFT_778627 [Cladochytrium replicatum]|nr:hypothetical protein BJ742DRAFT_778627 [Cladochytrium replicatum]
MPLSLTTRSLIQGLVEGIPAITNIVGYLNGYGPAGMFPAIMDPLGHVALLFETSQTVMLSFAALPEHPMRNANRTSSDLWRIGQSPPQIPGFSLAATNTISGISGTLLHAALGVLQVSSLATLDETGVKRKMN